MFRILRHLLTAIDRISAAYGTVAEPSDVLDRFDLFPFS